MHLAVSGKLVGQNMEDGSASELVEKLSKEKSGLEGRINN